MLERKPKGKITAPGPAPHPKGCKNKFGGWGQPPHVLPITKFHTPPGAIPGQSFGQRRGAAAGPGRGGACEGTLQSRRKAQKPVGTLPERGRGRAKPKRSAPRSRRCFPSRNRESTGVVAKSDCGRPRQVVKGPAKPKQGAPKVKRCLPSERQGEHTEGGGKRPQVVA
jgi:hypothetical protein